MTLEMKQNQVLNFEATSDGKKIHRKNGSKDFGNTKSGSTIIAELSRGAEMKQNGWSEKEGEVQEDFKEFIWGVGPEAIYQMTRVEYSTEQDKIVEDLIPLFNEYFLPKRNIYHKNRKYFRAKQTETEISEELWRRLIEIEKECNFGTTTAKELSQNS